MFTKLLEVGWRRSFKAEKQKNKSDIQQIDYREIKDFSVSKTLHHNQVKKWDKRCMQPMTMD